MAFHEDSRIQARAKVVKRFGDAVPAQLSGSLLGKAAARQEASNALGLGFTKETHKRFDTDCSAMRVDEEIKLTACGRGQKAGQSPYGAVDGKQQHTTYPAAASGIELRQWLFTCTAGCWAGI